MNDFTKKLYKLAIGKTITLKRKDGSTIGVFLRVPSGWVYRYTLRNSSCCCFIPYTEDMNFWDIELPINKCPFCASVNVLVNATDVDDSSKYRVTCSECNAATKRYDTKYSATKAWNSIKLSDK